MRVILVMHKIGCLRLVENSLTKLFVGERVQTDVAQSVKLLRRGQKIGALNLVTILI